MGDNSTEGGEGEEEMVSGLDRVGRDQDVSRLGVLYKPTAHLLIKE